MGVTIAFALLFMVVKYFEYQAKFDHGTLPATTETIAIDWAPRDYDPITASVGDTLVPHGITAVPL